MKSNNLKFIIPFFIWFFLAGCLDANQDSARYNSEDVRIFDRIAEKAEKNNWNKIPFNQMIGKIGLEFAGTPYEGGTLESTGPEVCTINLRGLDCVTFYETVLGMARIFSRGEYDFQKLIEEIIFMRYRNGKINDYTSRLHYTSDWFFDNQKKGVGSNITSELGGKDYSPLISFMSENPQYYSKLKHNPEMVKHISNIESRINAEQNFYIPKSKVGSMENLLQTGDIVAFTTSKNGLDYAHTGIIYVDENKTPRLLHASTTHKKVYLDQKLSIYINSVKSHTGITVFRPVKP